jgi:flagellar hook-associated protein 1 FlgK
MPSQFFGLNIAYTGLLAANAALNTTANNISNVQTDGYSRQQVSQQAANALRVFQTYGCAGAGVETLAIERVRDEFYDGRYWDNNAKVGEYSQKQYYMEQIEDYFDDDGKSTGFKTIFDQFLVTGMEELLKDPSGSTAKTQFIGYAGSLTTYFNGTAGNLEKIQKDVNQEIKLKVDEMNSLAGEIATLNKQINTIELTGVTANELRDRRTLLIDQLSEIVDVDVTETPIVDTNNPDRETGANRYIVKIAGGQILVDGSEYNGLECVARESYEKVNQTDIDGLYDVYWENGQKFNLYNTAMGGALRGLVEMRDGNNNENFNGVVSAIGTTTGADGKTHDTVTVEVNQSYLTDMNKLNLTELGGIINLGNQEFYFDSWEYSVTYDANNNPVYSYTFTLSDTEKNPVKVTNDRVGKTANVGTAIDYQGIPYYMSQMNEWVRTFSETVNDILTSGYDSNGDVGIKMFTGNLSTTDEQYELTDEYRYDQESYEAYQERVAALVKQKKQARIEALKTDYMNNQNLSEADALTAANQAYDATPAWKQADQEDAEKEAIFKVSVSDDSYYRVTASNFDVLTALELDPDRLANRYDQGDGVEQNDLLEDLKLVGTDVDKMKFRGSSASEFLQNILSDVALNASAANTLTESFTDVATTIDTQRLSISGVDEDEEAISLVKYQNAYNLASRMIQTLTEIYDRLILETGV